MLFEICIHFTHYFHLLVSTHILFCTYYFSIFPASGFHATSFTETHGQLNTRCISLVTRSCKTRFCGIWLLQCRLFTVLYFSVRSPRSHANSETGAIFVYIASAAQRTTTHRGGRVSGSVGRASQPPTLISPTSAPSVDCRPLSRLRSQYKQRMAPVLEFACNRGNLTEK